MKVDYFSDCVLSKSLFHCPDLYLLVLTVFQTPLLQHSMSLGGDHTDTQKVTYSQYPVQPSFTPFPH